MHAFDSINHFFRIGQMIIPGSSYWNIEETTVLGKSLFHGHTRNAPVRH